MSTVRTCTRIYRKQSVNVSVFMSKSSTEAVYEYIVSGRTGNYIFSTTKMAL